MSVYIGFYRPTPEYRSDSVLRARQGQAPDSEALRRIRELPGSLPEGCRILAAYTTMSVNQPNLLIIDSPDTKGPDIIDRYYRGYLEFDWVPARVVGATEEERQNYVEGRSAGSR